MMRRRANDSLRMTNFEMQIANGQARVPSHGSRSSSGDPQSAIRIPQSIAPEISNYKTEISNPYLTIPAASSIAHPHLTDFTDDYASFVASWVRSEAELLWLAPGTPPPLTAEKVAAWKQERRERLLLWNGRDDHPIAYAELNDMPHARFQMWIGHFLLNPAHRGRAWGVRFAQALLARAFLECGASDVLLVVFPDNVRAIRCYERAGMIEMGQERKRFKTTGREHLFTRMGINRGRYRRLVAAGKMPADPLPMHSLLSVGIAGAP